MDTQQNLHLGNRAAWIPSHLSEKEALALRYETLTKLSNSVWSNVLDLQALFPRPAGSSRRSYKSKSALIKNGLVVKDFSRLDIILPSGAERFLQQCVPRPASIEALCVEIYAFQRSRSVNGTRRKPPWLSAGSPLSQVTSPNKLAQWFWSCCVQIAVEHDRGVLAAMDCLSS